MNCKDIGLPLSRDPFLLQPNMIPKLNWGKNARSVLSFPNWDALRFYCGATDRGGGGDLLYSRHTTFPNCRSCGVAKDALELHECWEFDDDNCVQKLSAIVPICTDCHGVVHFGHSTLKGHEQQALRHLSKVRGWTEAQAHGHVIAAIEVWKMRSARDYRVDLSLLFEIFPPSKIHLGWINKPKPWNRSRLDCIRWAQDHLAAKDVVVLDTETTGLPFGPDKNDNVEVIELGIVSITGRKLYSQRFRPIYKIPRRTTNIHGITNIAVKHCPRFVDEYSKISDLLAGKTILAYNSRFDAVVMARTCDHYKLPQLDSRWECIMRMYRSFAGQPKYLRLPGGTHSALDDAKAALTIVRLMSKDKLSPRALQDQKYLIPAAAWPFSPKP